MSVSAEKSSKTLKRGTAGSVSFKNNRLGFHDTLRRPTEILLCELQASML